MQNTQTPPPPPPPTVQLPELEWVTLHDPAEHAFSIDVPKDWVVQGGAYRFGYLDVRTMLDMRSPDGNIVVRINDASVPAYHLPAPMIPPPGQAFVKPGFFQMVVSPYVEGKRFAELYAPRRFAPVCQHLTPLPGNWDVAPSHTEPQAVKASEGRVVYSCQTTAGPHIAGVYAKTTLFQPPQSPGFWTVFLISVLSTPDQADFATAVVTHSVKTIKKNPQWEAYQNQVSQMAVGAMVLQAQQAINNISAAYQSNIQKLYANVHQAHANQAANFSANLSASRARFDARMAEQSKNVESFNDVLLGQANMIDPMSGQTFKVSTGPYNNYYRNGRGDIVNANGSPGIGFHQINLYNK